VIDTVEPDAYGALLGAQGSWPGLPIEQLQNECATAGRRTRRPGRAVEPLALVALALGVLIVVIAAAFFFFNRSRTST